MQKVGNTWLTTVIADRVYFGGMLLGSAATTGFGDVSTLTDRLGTAVAGYPYGTDVGSVTAGNDQPDFATYTKDATTGFEYAMNRYYSAGLGRFLSVDPKASSARTNSPLTWNRYGYNAGDPINGLDPSGSDEICYGAPGDYDASHCFYNPYDVIEQNPQDPTQTVNQDGAPTDDSCTPTESNPSPDPSCGTGPPPPPIQPDPTCQAIFWYVPWAPSGLIPGRHSFFYVRDGTENVPLPGGQEGWDVIDAGPQYLPPRVQGVGGWLKHPVVNFGFLITNVSPNGLYNEEANSPNYIWYQKLACATVTAIESLANSLNRTVKYSGPFAYNSNSFTYTLNVDFNLGVTVPWYIQWELPEWGTLIP